MPQERRISVKGLSILLALLGLLLWQRRVIADAGAWVLRAHRADRSDLYLGHTNGYPNRQLVDQARDYLADLDRLDASGNVTAPEALRPLNIHIDVAWFRRHAPDRVDFDPFVSSSGEFRVTWLYFPGCQKAVWKSARSDPSWRNLKGQPCYPVCRLSILMASDLRLNALKLDSPLSSL